METLNAEGVQGPLNQRTSERRSRRAKDCTVNAQRSLEGETNLSLRSNKSDRGLINSLEVLVTIIDLQHLQDGDAIFLPQHIHLRHHNGKQAATCGQLGAGVCGNLRPGVNSDFSFNCSCDVISLAGRLISWQSMEWCKQYTYRAHVSLMHSCCTVILSLTSRIHLAHHAWPKNHGAHC